MTAAPQRTMPLVLVETARTLAGVNGWVTESLLRFAGGSEGSGQALGKINLYQPWGVILPEYRTSFENVGVSPDIRKSGRGSLLGYLTRLLVQDDAGTIRRGSGIYSASYVAAWHGQIVDLTVQPDGTAAPHAGGSATWLAVGLFSVLEQIVLRTGWVQTSDASGVIDPGFLPPFNQLPGGDRSASTVTVNGASVYVHDLHTVVTGNKWTARNVLDLLLAGATRPAPYDSTTPLGWAWTIADPDNCLAYHPMRLDLDGMTLAQAINVLISSRRGLTWWLSVSGTTATINVRSGIDEAITVGLVTIPASSKTATLNPVGDSTIADLAIGEDQQSCYDVVELRAERPWVAITLDYDGTETCALEKGWTVAAEALHETRPQSPHCAHAWRRFQLRPGWNGKQYNAVSGLRDTLATETSEDYGVKGHTGARSFGNKGAAQATPATALRLERDLPCSQDFTTRRLGARQQPFVVVGSGSSWHAPDWSIDVQQTGIVIDDGDNGLTIKTYIDAGHKILVTVGMRESQPLRVSWQAAQADLPRALPRIKVIDVPCEQWLVLAGTIKGVETNGTALKVQATDLSVRDDLPQLRGLLALARAYFAGSTFRLSWRRQGVFDIGDTYRPGTLITALNRGDRTLAIGSVITRRTWSVVERDGSEQYDTTYETEVVFPEVESII